MAKMLVRAAIYKDFDEVELILSENPSLYQVAIGGIESLAELLRLATSK